MRTVLIPLAAWGLPSANSAFAQAPPVPEPVLEVALRAAEAVPARCGAAVHAVRRAHLLNEKTGRRAVAEGLLDAQLAVEGVRTVMRIRSAGCAVDFFFEGEPQPLAAERSALFRGTVAKLELAASSLEESEASRAAGRFEPAWRQAQQACAAREEALGAAHPLVAQCNLVVARNAISLGRYGDALELATKAKATFEAVAGSGNVDTLAARNSMAQALFYVDRVAEMHENARAAWEGRRSLLGADARETLESQNTLAVSLRNLGRTREAIELYEDLIARRTRVDGPDAVETLRARGNVAAAWFLLGDVQRAWQIHESIFARNRERLGASHPTTLFSLRETAQAQWEAGRRSEALERLEAALPDVLSKYGASHPEALRVHTLLAVFYETLGRREESERLHRHVLAARTASLGAAHSATLLAAYNVASTLLLDDRPREALEIAERGLSALPPDADPSRAAGLRRVQGVALLELGRPQEARAAFEAAMSPAFTRQPDLESAVPNDMSAFQLLARARFAEGEREAALADLERAHAAIAKRLGASHPSALVALGTLAARLEEAGRENDARARLAELVERSEARLASGLAFDNASSSELSERVASNLGVAGYRTNARLLARVDAKRALAATELSKGRTLGQRIAARDPVARDERRRSVALRLAKAEENLAASDPGTPAFLEAAAERARAESEMRDLMKGMRRYSPEPDPVELARQLPPDTAFISYVADGDRVAAVIARRSEVASVDLGTIAALGETVEAARRLLASADPAGERVWRLGDGGYRWALTGPAGATRVRQPAEVLRYLSERLLVPLRRHVEASRVWVVSPDGPLAYLPIEPLPWNGREVIQTRDVSYAVSLSLLVRMPARVETATPRSMLGIGISSAEGLPGLPATEEEAREVTALFPRSTLLLGRDATEEALQKLDASGALSRFHYVHLAAHATLSPRSSDLSAVHFTSGRITAAEWGAYRLNADLVVLSACETGLGVARAGEGVLGLPYAFTMAGARRLVLALWPVADEGAGEFMPRFYRRILAGKSPREALRETKLEMARSRGPWSAPRHWAPYVLFGSQ